MKGQETRLGQEISFLFWSFFHRKVTSAKTRQMTMSLGGGGGVVIALNPPPPPPQGLSYIISPEVRLNIDSNLYFELNWAYLIFIWLYKRPMQTDFNYNNGASSRWQALRNKFIWQLFKSLGPFIRGKKRRVLNKARTVPLIRTCLI